MVGYHSEESPSYALTNFLVKRIQLLYRYDTSHTLPPILLIVFFIWDNLILLSSVTLLPVIYRVNTNFILISNQEANIESSDVCDINRRLLSLNELGRRQEVFPNY